MADGSLGVPGEGNGMGRSKGASGKLMPGSKPLGGQGVVFDGTSAQFNPSPRDIGKPAPHSPSPGFPAKSHKQ
jgi:hypothetical protein